jgi:quercetin dioxygenase-like cupin family protein
VSESVSINAAVAFMHPEDVEKLFVPSSRREAVTLVPEYSRDEDGVDTVKVLMATPQIILFEASRPKGAVDRMHVHPDHESIGYQKKGRVRMTIGKETRIVEEGDSYRHPLGVAHQHEVLEDSVRIEIKYYPKGNAVESWNALVGPPGPPREARED